MLTLESMAASPDVAQAAVRSAATSSSCSSKAAGPTPKPDWCFECAWARPRSLRLR
uniref:Secreted protein n=1 Tax=Macrostomum lignano TaxID=282301 RepID=A0A1I8I749_9PLAT